MIALGVVKPKNPVMKSHEESTYALLVRSEERSRGVLEIVLYASIALSAIASIWQFAQQPVELTAPGLIGQSSAITSDQA